MNFLRVASRVMLVLLWSGTLIVALAWLLGWQLPFNAEPVTVVLGLVSTAVTGLVNAYANLLDKRHAELQLERYSTSYALAYGYVNNFLEPAVTQLMCEHCPSDEQIRFYIYIPEALSELEELSIQRTLARIRERHYATSVINLNLSGSRARDVLTVTAERQGGVRYFDFPTTLLTLSSLVDYKVESQQGSPRPESAGTRQNRDQFDEQDKLALGKIYIDQFRLQLEVMIEQKGLADYVRFTDRHLGFLNEVDA